MSPLEVLQLIRRWGFGATLGGGLAALAYIGISPELSLEQMYVCILAGAPIGAALTQLLSRFLKPFGYYAKLVELAIHRAWTPTGLVRDLLTNITIDRFATDAESKKQLREKWFKGEGEHGGAIQTESRDTQHETGRTEIPEADHSRRKSGNDGRIDANLLDQDQPESNAGSSRGRVKE